MKIFRSLLIAWKLGFRQIWQHPGRAALTLASITIGVAAVVAVTIAARATDHAMEAMFQSLTGRASLEIVGDSGGSIDGSVVETVQGITGVETLSPILQRQSILTFKNHRIKLMTLGIDPKSYQAVHPFTIKEGKSLEETKGVLLESNLAQSIGVHPGDTVKILTRRGRLSVQVVGIFQSQETMITSGGAGVLMTLQAAQFTSKMPNKIHSVQLVLDSSANETTVRSEIASRLPPGIRVATPGAQNSFAEETSLSIRHGMMTARAFLLLVATLIIANTYLINVTERRSQFGIMRAVGATRQQVSAILCCEAFILGTIGAILGWLGGMIGAGYVNDAMGRLYETTLPSVPVGPASLALACLFGIG
ncbi:MAG: ABC transporter permease, partial [Pirellulaceae bacterium]